MEIIKSATAVDLGNAAAALTAKKINAAIAENGEARIILSEAALYVANSKKR